MNKALLILALTLTLACIPASAQAGKDAGTVNIHLIDYCDPVSFNLVLGDGACVRDTTAGLITFDGFIGELTAEKAAGAWWFSPTMGKAGQHDQLAISNLGGELHTFTKVKKFGGGFVAPLNDLSGNTRVAPECGTVVDGNIIPQPPGPDNLFIPAGGTATHSASGGLVRYQCCIHPWMRTTIHQRHGSHHD